VVGAEAPTFKRQQVPQNVPPPCPASSTADCAETPAAGHFLTLGWSSAIQPNRADGSFCSVGSGVARPIAARKSGCLRFLPDLLGAADQLSAPAEWGGGYIIIRRRSSPTEAPTSRRSSCASRGASPRAGSPAVRRCTAGTWPPRFSLRGRWDSEGRRQRALEAQRGARSRAPAHEWKQAPRTPQRRRSGPSASSPL